MPLVKDLIEIGRAQGYSEEFLAELPTECVACGMPTVMRPSFTTLSCSNPRCSVKVASRVVAICKKMGVLGVGQSVAEKMVDFYELTNPLAVLEFSDIEDGSYYSVYEGSPLSLNKSVGEAVHAYLQKPMTLSEYVSLAYLPGIQDSASKIFANYASLDEAYTDIEEGGIPFIQQRLGISLDRVSLRAGQVFETLLEFKSDLYAEIETVRLLSDAIQGTLRELRVCISDSAGAPYVSKRDFMNQADAVALQQGIHITWASSVTKTLDYLVHAGDRYTNKLAKAESYGIPVLTGFDFITVLECKD